MPKFKIYFRQNSRADFIKVRYKELTGMKGIKGLFLVFINPFHPFNPC